MGRYICVKRETKLQQKYRGMFIQSSSQHRHLNNLTKYYWTAGYFGGMLLHFSIEDDCEV